MKNPFDYVKQLFGATSEASADELLMDANETSLEISDDAFIDGDMAKIAASVITSESMKH